MSSHVNPAVNALESLLYQLLYKKADELVNCVYVVSAELEPELTELHLLADPGATGGEGGPEIGTRKAKFLPDKVH